MRKDNFKLIKIVGCSIAIGIINGLLGGGGGMLCVPALIKLGKLSTKQAHATAIFAMLPISIVSSIVYSLSVKIDVNTLLLITVGSLFGAFIGTKLLKNFKSIVLDYIFVIVIFVAGFRMLF